MYDRQKSLVSVTKSMVSMDAEEGSNGNSDVETGVKRFTPGQKNKNDVDLETGSDAESTSQQSTFKFGTPGVRILVSLVLFLGFATCVAFLGIGISGAVDDQQQEFHRSATDTINKLRNAFDDYVNAASMVHGRCRHKDFTRQDFRELFEYLIASGLDFKAVQFDPNITHAERPAAEEEARQYYAENYPHVDYQGFKGFNTPTSGLVPRMNQSFYFPIHYMEPIFGNEAAIDLDYHSSESRTRAVHALFDHEMPSLTDRLSLVKEAGETSRCGDHVGTGYGVVLMHPGVKLQDSDDIWPRDFSSVVLCIPALITRATIAQLQTFKVFIHDRSDPSGVPVFLGAALVKGSSGEGTEITFLDEKVALEDIKVGHPRKKHEEDLKAANRIWTVTVVGVDEASNGDIVFVILGGAIILCASCLLAVWIWHSDRKTNRFNAMRAAAEGEKAGLILENARQATTTERELNDFIAHEVRNPVAAAMAACNMMIMAIDKDNPLQDKESLDVAKSDLNIIDSSLRFVNDLLRNMLDMHRAANNQLQVHMMPVDLLRDILEPVGGMLYRRSSKIQMIVECPENFYVMADSLRLKQVILNLGRNSTKFIEEGFIRLKAEEVEGSVRIYIDDSGSGIPLEKRELLFAKFQESLDMLSQGTVSWIHCFCTLLVLYMDSDS
jgi:signal transduction histidine kinase